MEGGEMVNLRRRTKIMSNVGSRNMRRRTVAVTERMRMGQKSHPGRRGERSRSPTVTVDPKSDS